ncbi:MAG: hypothetical protein H7Y86_22465 [Rhizobacter sp.]|nr:hypothetical protein [Ferruginibacter sp.]
MKRFLFLLAIIVTGKLLFAQGVGIGTTSPHASAQLDVTSSSKGFLLPLLSQSQRLAIASPAEGLLVYDSTFQRFYQYQDGAWRYIINSDLWARSTTRDVVYNATDSVGIGTSIPQQRLDVNGDILSSNNISITSSITAGGTASGTSVLADGNASAASSAVLAGNVNGGNDLIIDNSSATLQFKNSGINKTFFQVSGNDLRLGTNSGNQDGKIIVRMNGENLVEIDSASNLTLLKWGSVNDFDAGKLVMGDKLVKNSYLGWTSNYLPLLYGRVFSDGSSASMWPTSGSSDKISTGIYEIDTHRTDLSAFGIIVVTVAGTTVPRICTGTFQGAGKFRVEIFTLAGSRVDNDFYFTIIDPLN